MAILVLNNAKIYVGGYDVSGDMNRLGLRYGAELKDNTTFGSAGSSGTRSRVGGLKTVQLALHGLWQADETPNPQKIDKTLWVDVGVSDEVLSVIGKASGAAGIIAAGDRAFLTQGIEGDYRPGAQIGELLEFDATYEGRGTDLIRGVVLDTRVAVSASGNGAGQNLGAISATQYAYAALHVLAVSGDRTVTAVVQSHPDNTWAAPTARISFAAQSAIGAVWGTRLAGAVTDTWWRLNYTIGGTNGTITFLVTFGIQ